MTTETFKTASFDIDGMWMHYRRESGERVFIARFKHRLAPKCIGKAAFKRALCGTSVDAYLAKLAEGQTPVHAAGLYDALVAEFNARKAA